MKLSKLYVSTFLFELLKIVGLSTVMLLEVHQHNRTTLWVLLTNEKKQLQTARHLPNTNERFEHSPIKAAMYTSAR